MSYFIAPTWDYNASGETDTGAKSHSVKYKLVSTGGVIDPADAWRIAWQTLRLKYPFFAGCKLANVQVGGKTDDSGRMYEVTGQYVRPGNEDPMFATLSFSMRGGREKKIHSFATTAYQAATETEAPPDFKHAIGFDNGTFQGVDVVVPTNGFSVDVELPSTLFNAANLAWCWSITGTMNTDPLWGFKQGELLFLGPTGNTFRKENQSTQAFDLWYRLSFEFEAAPSLVNANISPFTGINKQGHQYLWVYHRDKKDETAKQTIPVAAAAYVETVYRYSDFSWFSNLHW